MFQLFVTWYQNIENRSENLPRCLENYGNKSQYHDLGIGTPSWRLITNPTLIGRILKRKNRQNKAIARSTCQVARILGLSRIPSAYCCTYNGILWSSTCPSQFSINPVGLPVFAHLRCWSRRVLPNYDMQFSCEAKAMKLHYSQETKMHAMNARWIRGISLC